MKKTYTRNKNRYREIKLLDRSLDRSDSVARFLPLMTFIATIIAIVGIFSNSIVLIFLSATIMMLEAIAITLEINKLVAASLTLMLFALITIYAIY